MALIHGYYHTKNSRQSRITSRKKSSWAVKSPNKWSSKNGTPVTPNPHEIENCQNFSVTIQSWDDSKKPKEVILISMTTEGLSLNFMFFPKPSAKRVVEKIVASGNSSNSSGVSRQ